MKQYSKRLFSITMLLGTAALTANVAPYLQFRSQGRNTARKIVGETSFHTDLYDMEAWYGSFDLTLEYDRSFRPQTITNALFGADAISLPTVTNNNTSSSVNKHGRGIIVSGSEFANRAATDWMAENFLLPRNFQSVMTFSPLVQNVLVNFDWFMGLDNWCSGLYFRLYGPVVNNRTSLRFNEVVTSPGTNTGDTGFTYQPGFFNLEGVAANQLFTKAEQFFAGEQLANPIPLAGTENVTFIPLQYAKMNVSGHKSKTGFAELRGEFGWNYLRENYRAGLNLQVAAPTGTRPNAKFVLEPEIGNGKHWELGVGLKGLWSMWRSEDEERHFDFIVEADITHLFKAKQTRTFDLVGKPNSRYMLAQKLVSNADANPRLDGVSDAEVQFSGEYTPVANISTRKVNVSIGVQGDVVAMFSYNVRGFSWDLGYNFWGMSTEKISFASNNNTSSITSSASKIVLPFPEDTWALKGDASVVGALTGTTTPVFLAATEGGDGSNSGIGATIHAGTNAGLDSPETNTGVDNPAPATALNGTTAGVQVDVVGTTDTQIGTSNPAVFIKLADLDINGARMRGFSNKIFTHFNYSWNNCCDRWVPFVGLGVSGEFGSHSGNSINNTSSIKVNNTSSSSNNNHTNFGLSQWAIWIKGGVSFH